MSNNNKNIKQEMSRNSRHLHAKKINGTRSHLNLLIEWDITANRRKVATDAMCSK